MSFFIKRGIRNFSTPAKQWPSYQQTMTAKSFHEKEHAVKTTQMWKWFNIVLVVPSLVACVLFTVPPEIEHLKHINSHKREFEPFSYMRKRSHEYPWGDDSLFHNENANPVILI